MRDRQYWRPSNFLLLAALLLFLPLLGNASGQNPVQADQANQPPAPPAVYYGALLVVGGAGQLSVEARIGGQVCGRGQVIWQGEAAYYSIPVEADSNEWPGCGAPGRVITFYAVVELADTQDPSVQEMIPTSNWENTVFHELVLHPKLILTIPTISPTPPDQDPGSHTSTPTVTATPTPPTGDQDTDAKTATPTPIDIDGGTSTPTPTPTSTPVLSNRVTPSKSPSATSTPTTTPTPIDSDIRPSSTPTRNSFPTATDPIRATITQRGGVLEGVVSSLYLTLTLPFDATRRTLLVSMDVAALVPTNNELTLIGNSFVLSAEDEWGQSVHQFVPPVTLVAAYQQAVADDTHSRRLTLFAWDKDKKCWYEIPTVADTEANRLTATLGQLTNFAIVAVPYTRIYLPALLR